MNKRKLPELTPNQASQLLPVATLNRMANELQLVQCSFTDEEGSCDMDGCGCAIGRVWVSISSGPDGDEANYYVCDACLPEKFIDFLREMASYAEHSRCYICADATGVFRKTASYWDESDGKALAGKVLWECSACRDLGVIFRPLRPYAPLARALERLAVAQSRAHYTTGRKRKRWRRAMVKWARIAGALATESKPRETRPRSLRNCAECRKPYRAAWIQPYRRYCERCGECVLVDELAKHPQEIVDVVLGLFTREELTSLRGLKPCQT